MTDEDKNLTTLDKLEIGQTGRILAVGGEGALRQHFLDMGIIPGAPITFMKYAPMGDPMEFTIHGYELTLRVSDAADIEVLPMTAAQVEEMHRERDKCLADDDIEHPGLGEGGRFHDKEEEDPLPEDKMLTFALAGNQNCGKTTLFNQLTGANQHVGNFPGVTVDRKSGQIRGHKNTDVVDLPGIYSMSPYTSEEIVSRQFILDEKPQGIINIVDATNIQRSLYLSMQLMELGIPMVLALNMMDEVQSNGGFINVNEMEAMLGIPVIPISAVRNEGVDELVTHALHVAHYQERPQITDFCGKDDHGGAVHRCLHAVMHLIEDHAIRAQIPVRFAATKIIEGDCSIMVALGLDLNERQAIEHIIVQMEEERGLDRAAAIAEMRFAYIAKVAARTVTKPRESKEHQRSRKLDNILTGRFTAIPAFIVIMAAVFYLTFNVIGAWLQGLVAFLIEKLGDVVAQAMEAADVSAAVQSLVTDGIFGGVGAVISFVPLIAVLFFFLSLLEDTGYMARVAFVMDKLLRKLGLSGRSIVPLLIGFGCTVPAIMSSRTLPSERDRILTVLITPFMSCSTKIIIYGFICATFFPGKGGFIMIALYLLGIIIGILTALVTRGTVFKGDAVPFVMELPNYRLPTPKSIAHLVWDKSSDFLRRAFTVIFLATIVVWFLQSFGTDFSMVEDHGESLLGIIAGWIAPIFNPLGLGDWRIVTSLISGFLAKETVVSTLSVLMAGQALSTLLTPGAALALLVFCLLYTPCIASISCVTRELGVRWAIGIVVYQCVVAWVIAFIVKLVAAALGIL